MCKRIFIVQGTGMLEHVLFHRQDFDVVAPLTLTKPYREGTS